MLRIKTFQHEPGGETIESWGKRATGREYRCDVVAEHPKLRDYIEDMRKALSAAMGLDTDRVSIKASTNNGLGFIGGGEGIAAYAVALIEDQ